MHKLAVTLVALALMAAACTTDPAVAPDGTDEVPDPVDTTQPTPADPGPTDEPVRLPGQVNNRGTVDRTADGARVEITIEMHDFAFEPTFVRAQPGATINLELENEGQAPHTFTTTEIDVELASGEQREITFTLPDDGETVRFICRFHVAGGMQGAFYT